MDRPHSTAPARLLSLRGALAAQAGCGPASGGRAVRVPQPVAKTDRPHSTAPQVSLSLRATPQVWLSLRAAPARLLSLRGALAAQAGCGPAGCSPAGSRSFSSLPRAARQELTQRDATMAAGSALRVRRWPLSVRCWTTRAPHSIHEVHSPNAPPEGIFWILISTDPLRPASA